MRPQKGLTFLQVKAEEGTTEFQEADRRDLGAGAMDLEMVQAKLVNYCLYIYILKYINMYINVSR